MVPLGLSTRTRALHLIAVAGALGCTPALVEPGGRPDPADSNADTAPAEIVYPQPQRVLLVIWDTVRAGHLSACGYPRETTPHLDALAASSTVFTQANPGSYWTLSSMASLFSGMFSHNHRVDYDLDAEGYVLDDGILTLAEAMQARGFYTAVFTNQSLFYQNASLSQGFDEWRFLDGTAIVPNAESLMDRMGEEPWFLVAYWMGAHAPYIPDAQHDLWSSGSVDDINVRGCDGVDPGMYPESWVCFNDLNSGAVQWNERQWQFIRDKYDGTIHQHDAWLGSLWAALEQRGLADTTLFTLTADHGEALADHGQINAWHVWPYDDTQLVPLIVRFPEVFPAASVGTQVRTMDLYATLMRLTGGLDGHPMDSEPLTEVIEGRGGDRVSVGATAAGDGRQWYRFDGYKLIWSREREEQQARELFDLGADPHEQDNLWDLEPSRVAQLEAAHAAFLEETAIQR
ncbi:MAG: sulfatase [Pseudomonadota bacterium]